MRLLSFELLRFGPFTDTALDFSAGGKGLHVIYGANEAGKSTTLRAIAGLLYGIPEATRDAHRHKMPDLRVSATLETSAGERLRLVRRKGRVNTLTDGEGAPVDEARMREVLGGVSRDMFESMFGLNHETLRSGGEDLLKVEGKVGESLFGAGLGAGVYGVQRALESEASTLFAPQGKNHPLNQALRAFAEAKKRTIDLSLPASEWNDRARELENARTACNVSAAELRAHRVTQARLRRVFNALPLLTRLRELIEQHDALGEIVAVPEGCADLRRESQHVIREALPREESLREQIAATEAQQQALALPLALLDEERAAEDIRDRLGTYRQAKADRPRLRDELMRAEDRVHAALRALGRPNDLPSAEQLAPTTAEYARLRALGAERARLDATLQNESRQLASRRARLESEKARFAELPPERDSETLRRALERARKAGDLDARLRRMQHEMSTVEAEAQRRSNALGLITGTLDELVALPLPSAETIERFENEWLRASAESSRLASTLAENESHALQVHARLAELERGMPVPTEDDLRRAREARDKAWRGLRRDVQRAVDGVALATDEACEAFERSVVAADEIGDRLRHEADRVATVAALYAQRNEHTARRATLLREQNELQAQNDARSAAWEAAWATCGISPLSPSEMRGWAARHERLLDASVRLNALEAEHRSVLELTREYRRALVAALDNRGDHGPEDPRALGPLVEYAESVLETADAQVRVRRELVHLVRELSAEVGALERAQHAAREAIDEWKHTWASAVLPLGAPADASPEVIAVMLEDHVALSARLDEVRDARRRCSTLSEEADRFASDVAALCERAAPDLRALPPADAADRVLKRLQKAREDRVLRDELAKRLRVAKAELIETEGARKKAARQLRDLREATGCSDDAALEEAERRADLAATLRASIDELRARLVEVGDGSSIDTLSREAQGQTIDGLRASLRAIDDELATIERRKSELDEHVGRLDQKLTAMDGRAAAADAALDAQSALARVRELTEQYVRHHLAGLILKNEIERYRERNQGPVLRRASDLFCRLTLQAYDALKTGFDDRDNAVLVCVRSDGSETGVAGLSDGTRDQLYLALRLASLERHLETSPSMPLIVDDILIHVDDNRAAATLSALGELATRNQIFFFTHHTRLVELARAAVPASCLAVHSLDAFGRAPLQHYAVVR